jgi:hypothetical protein
MKSVSPENSAVSLAVFVEQQVAGAFHRVAGSVQHAEGQFAHLEFFAVFGDVRIETRVGIRARTRWVRRFFCSRSTWPLTKSAWKCVSKTYLILALSFSAFSK